MLHGESGENCEEIFVSYLEGLSKTIKMSLNVGSIRGTVYPNANQKHYFLHRD
jgi:hypothetical protein